jgi:hypothetical protein
MNDDAATNPDTGALAADAAKPERIEHEVEELRDELDGLVGELNRRSRRALDWREQLRAHTAEVAAGALVAGVALWGGLAWRARQRRRMRSPWVRMQNVTRALISFSKDPDQLPAERGSRRWAAPIVGALSSAAIAAARAAAMRAVQDRMRRQF